MSQETSIIINHNGFLVWGPKGPKNNKNNNLTLCMTMPQAAGKKNIRSDFRLSLSKGIVLFQGRQPFQESLGAPLRRVKCRKGNIKLQH